MIRCNKHGFTLWIDNSMTFFGLNELMWYYHPKPQQTIDVGRHWIYRSGHPDGTEQELCINTRWCGQVRVHHVV